MISVTVIVPTRNRADTLTHALDTLLRIDDDRLEIIVSDNASVDDTKAVVESKNDPRIRYIHTGKPLGMTQNWEFALSHATGDWVGFMGDDDGMLGSALTRLRHIVEETGVDAVRADMCSYVWPSLSGDANGKLIVPLGRDRGPVEAGGVLSKVLDGSLPYVRLPVLYNGGFARRDVLNELRDSDGRFFQSCIPDVYSGVLLALHLDRFAWSDEPFFLNGASIHSTGTSLFAKPEDSARSRAINSFHSVENIPFHPSVPMNRNGTIPKSIQIIVLESWLQAAGRLGIDVKFTPELQLKSILLSAPNAAAISDWVEDFSALHGISPDGAIRDADRRRRRRQRAVLLERIWIRNWHSGLAPDRSIANVREATAVAEEVLRSAPSSAVMPFRNILRVLRQPVAKNFAISRALRVS